MWKLQALLVGLILASGAAAHPMGNFSVSHYSRLDFNGNGVRLTYVLDLAEIPTLELFQQWQIDGRDEAQLQKKASAQAAAWLQNLAISVDGKQLSPRLGEVKANAMDGAGGMLVLRVLIKADLSTAPGQLSFEDRNYANRTGWKEIVIRGGEGVALIGPSRSGQDVSHELTSYPADPTLAPPQDLSTFVKWSLIDGLTQKLPDEMSRSKSDGMSPSSMAPSAKAGLANVNSTRLVKRDPAATPTTDPAILETTSTAAGGSFSQRQPAGPGAVVRGDFLSAMLRDKKFGLGSILLGLLVAFGLGAMHALSPGHGKTIVAAYLVGSRGTLKHALFLGSMVTFTHTISVFLLGLGVLFFQKYVVPDQIIPLLGAVSGLSIVCIGGWLLYQRAKALMGTAERVHTAEHEHHHHHAGETENHHHGPDHHHDLELGHAHASHHTHFAPVAVEAPVSVMAGEQVSRQVFDHRADVGGHSHIHEHHDHGSDRAHRHVHPHHGHDQPFIHTHTHDGHTHSHAVPDTKLTLGGLIALGASGGLVPCPSALILLLSAIALGHTALGLGLLAAFSTGLALVLMGIGALVLFAKQLLPSTESTRSHPLFRLVPVFSSVVVIVMGLMMTMAALGWIQPIRGLGT
jgi:nickel/cobalt transporter (NicO) family protein